MIRIVISCQLCYRFNISEKFLESNIPSTFRVGCRKCERYIDVEKPKKGETTIYDKDVSNDIYSHYLCVIISYKG